MKIDQNVTYILYVTVYNTYVLHNGCSILIILLCNTPYREYIVHPLHIICMLSNSYVIVINSTITIVNK